jgi:Zn-dependent M28 family amino/carboxypeptidase
MTDQLLAVQAVVRRRVLGTIVVFLVLALACTSAAATPPSTPGPTAQQTPTATPEPEQLRLTALELVSAEAFAVLEQFLEDLGPRESATAQESAAADYLQERFKESGYETEIQRFTVEDFVLAGMGLKLRLPDLEEFDALPLERSGLGDVSGLLTPVGLAMPGDLPDGGLEGRIALARRGVVTFQAKAENVFAAGAVGLVIYNNVFGLFRGVLATEPDFPVISLSRSDGEAIEDLLADFEIEASITLTMENLPSQNVIAEKKGPGEAVVVLGGHYDSVPGIVGANDNASGAAVLVTLARMLAEVDLPFTLRIIPFGSEELGLLGSQFYVESLSEEELENTKAMLNFDALGTGSGVSVFGDGDIAALVSDIGDQIGVDVAVTLGLRGGSSDFASFREAGVPYLMFFGDDVSRIHSERDTLEFVEPEMLGGAAAVAAALLRSQEFAELIANR